MLRHNKLVCFENVCHGKKPKQSHMFLETFNKLLRIYGCTHSGTVVKHSTHKPKVLVLPGVRGEREKNVKYSYSLEGPKGVFIQAIIRYMSIKNQHLK
jgi:hypothetical protein